MAIIIIGSEDGGSDSIIELDRNIILDIRGEKYGE